MTIVQRAHQFWTWFDTARFGLSFLNDVQPEEQDRLLAELFLALQDYHQGLTFSLKVEQGDASAHLVIWDDGSKVSKRRNKQLFRDCLSFPGWTFGRASGDPRAQELPDLSDELVFYREVRVDLLAVHAPDDHPRFLLTLYLPEYLGLSCRPHLAFLVCLFIGAKRYESLIHSIVFAASSGTEAPRGFLLVNLHEWMTRVQDTHPGLQDPAPLYLDQAPDLN